MNRFFLTGILILGCVCFTVGKSYACPIVEIETDPQECGQKVLDDEACVGQWVHFDGSGSSDDGSIEDYVWDFPADACDFEGIPSDDCNFCDSGSNCLDGNDCNVVKCYFDEPGEHEVWLSVKDDEGNWRSDFAPVYVVDVNDVTGDVNYACVGCNVTFTVVTDGPPNHYDPIVWSSSPPASPNSTQKGGATFTGYWSTPGPKTVTAKCCSAGSASDSVTIVEVDKVKAGTKETGETLYLANDYLDEPNDRTAINQSVEAILSPSNVAPDECFFWSPGCGSLPKICPAGQKTATFTEKDHGNYTVTATCGSSNKTMYIAIEGINIKTENISEANEMTETYNIFLNENFDQENDQNDLPGHEGCCSVDYEDPWIDWIYGDNSDEIGTIILETETYGDTNAQVKFTASPQKIYLHASDYENLWLDTYYAVSSLPSSLRVEGIDAGEMTLKAKIKTQDGYTAEDNLKIKVIRLNLMALDPAPSSDQHEICHKDKLIIPVNNNDSDSDGVMDLSDFNIPGGDPELAKIRLEKPAGAVASDISGNVTVGFSSKLKAFKDPNKATGSAPTSYSFSDLPVDIYLEGVTASSDILDSKVKVEMTLDSGVKCHDEIWYSVIEVELLVNNTESEDDDYVVKEKPSGARPTAWPKDGSAGPDDNHIPMKVRLQGPTGFSCKVKLSDSGTGDVTVKKTDGSAYPAEGETVTVGNEIVLCKWATRLFCG